MTGKNEFQVWREAVVAYFKTPSKECRKGPSKIMKISKQPISEPRFESGTTKHEAYRAIMPLSFRGI